MLGFRNMGNTCYLNSVLSILLNCPNFISLIESMKHKTDNKDYRIQSAVKLLESFKQLVSLKKQVKEQKFGVVKPFGIIQLMFNYLSHKKSQILQPFRQNDALECLSVILDAFEEGTQGSIDSHWQSGRIRRQIIRNNDKKIVDDKEETQITWNLQIPENRQNTDVPIQLSDCLLETFDNTLEKVKYKRDEDNEITDYIIRRSIKDTPKLFFLSLARWSIRAEKVMTPVDVPQTLEVKDKNYKLIGVICHMGSSIPSGHYYSVLIINDKAYRIDDSEMYPCPIPFPVIVQRHIYGILYQQI